MDFLKTYFQKMARDWCRLAIFLLIFLVVESLYHIPARALAYPALLCVAAEAAFTIYGYRNERRKHKEIERMLSYPAELLGDFPKAGTAGEEDYQRLVEHLQEEIRRISTEYAMKEQDSVDYYTTWVHQIKTPIASMSLTLQGEDSPLARKLSGELFRIEQYVEMVLTFLRLDAKETDYVFKEYDLDVLVRNAVKKFSGEFIMRKLKLSYEPLKCTILTDEKWFSFVLEQILSNALKYTKEGEIRIYMEGETTLCIADTGIGISAQDLPRIFEKGYTGRNGRADKKASGLGLWLCRRICDNLGHGIQAESEPGRGTTIRLLLARKELTIE